MPVVIGGIGVASGLVKGLIGGHQRNEGKNILNGLQYPDEQIPQEVTDAANQGLPKQQYQQAMQNIQRQQMQSLRASNDRRGGLGLIPSLAQGSDDATLGLDVANAKARQANQFRLASWKDKVWQNNVKAKYDQQYNYGMGLVGQGNQNIVGGIDQTIAGGARAAYGSGLFGSGDGSGLGGGADVGNISGQGFGNQTQLTGGGLASGGV